MEEFVKLEKFNLNKKPLRRVVVFLVKQFTYQCRSRYFELTEPRNPATLTGTQQYIYTAKYEFLFGDQLFIFLVSHCYFRVMKIVFLGIILNIGLSIIIMETFQCSAILSLLEIVYNFVFLHYFLSLIVPEICALNTRF